ncbi:30S ribosomal protein S6 [Candidatus Omnitrophota bacterium]
MHKYETMFILRPDMNETEKTGMFKQIEDTFNKFNAKINSADIWSEKRKLYFDITLKGKAIKFREGLFYLVDFDSPAAEIKNITAAFSLNENILRFMISAKESIRGGV